MSYQRMMGEETLIDRVDQELEKSTKQLSEVEISVGMARRLNLQLDGQEEPFHLRTGDMETRITRGYCGGPNHVSGSGPIGQQDMVERLEEQLNAMKAELGATRMQVVEEVRKAREERNYYMKKVLKEVMKAKKKNIPVQGQGVTKKMKCFWCGKSHHAKDCYRISGACFNCGKIGHKIKDCQEPLRGKFTRGQEKDKSKF